MLSGPIWKPDAVLRLFLGVFVCLFVGALLANLLRHFTDSFGTDSPWRAVVSALFFQGAALLFIQRFLQDHDLRWSQAFGFLNDRKRALALGVVVTFCFLPVGWALQFVIGGIFDRLEIDIPIQPAVQALETSSGMLNRVALGAIVILLAPMAEEILFRGVLYPFIKQFGFPRLALWGTSVLFAAIHVNAVAFVPLLILSLVLTTLYEHTGNLLAPVAAHALFNAINFILLFFGDDFARLLPSQQ
ncbi:MAG TPA: CPBP family intramembrane metalloprotease [Verrucomicrobiota bacterium]|nr:CPBP family intramembrane metalloprotease [Verrucomicrobiota bacterium]